MPERAAETIGGRISAWMTLRISEHRIGLRCRHLYRTCAGKPSIVDDAKQTCLWQTVRMSIDMFARIPLRMRMRSFHASRWPGPTGVGAAEWCVRRYRTPHAARRTPHAARRTLRVARLHTRLRT